MKARIITALALAVLAILGLGPIPTTSLIAVYVVIFRPSWFKHLVDTVYHYDEEERQ